MVAAAMLVAMGTAIITGVLQAQGVASSAKMKNQATHYAQQLLEGTRAYAKSNLWDTFWGLAAPGEACELPACYTSTNFSDPNSNVTCNANGYVCSEVSGAGLISDAPFSQKVKLVQNLGINGNPNWVSVTAYVFYTDRGQQKTVQSTTYIANLQ